MFAEYKAYKAKEKSHPQESQVFYKYFDELLTEKERSISSENNEEMLSKLFYFLKNYFENFFKLIRHL